MQAVCYLHCRILRRRKRVALYILGAILSAFVWCPLGLIYLGYCWSSVVLYMALVCPYCYHHEARTCPAGYHHISKRFFSPRKGGDFGTQFKYTVVMYPGWALPPVLGVYLLITEFSWNIFVIVSLFCLVGFWILPKTSNRYCKTCENAENCPRGKKIEEKTDIQSHRT